MRFEPANLRLLSALVAGAFTASGCVTTFTAAPARLAALAGLPEDKEANVQTGEGLETIDGSAEVTLRSPERGTDEVRLSLLRSEGGVLVLPGNGPTVALGDIWSVEVTKPSPGKTAGLVLGIVGGSAVAAALVYEVLEGIALSYFLHR